MFSASSFFFRGSKKPVELTQAPIKLFLVLLTYVKPLDTVGDFLGEHREFLDKQYEEGLFIASGPKVPRDGGVILSVAPSGDMEKLIDIIKEDPFHKKGIADYKVQPFEVSKLSLDPLVEHLSELKGFSKKPGL